MTVNTTNGGSLRVSAERFQTLDQTLQVNAARTEKTTARAPERQWRTGAIEIPLSCLLVGAVLTYGWLQSSERHITPETGTGYYLGIAGSLLLLALLIYPLRKRFRSWRIIGAVRQWFRIHMLLGIVGPAVILLHSNFALGSANSTIALISMLIVAGSGFVGRFLYSRIHLGLYGRRAELREFVGDAGKLRAALCAAQLNEANVLQALQRYEAQRLLRTPGIRDSLRLAVTSSIAGRRMRKRLLNEFRLAIDRRGELEGWSKQVRRTRLSTIKSQLNSYFATVARAEAFTLYERLFSLWHMLHVPLFVILVVAVMVHVVAVHLY